MITILPRQCMCPQVARTHIMPQPVAVMAAMHLLRQRSMHVPIRPCRPRDLKRSIAQATVMPPQ